MPICITCSTPVKHLYTTYSKADDRALGKGVRLTQCPNCKRFADKYVEHDFVVLFIDLVLIKPQVYRHLLFNRLGRADNKLDSSIFRLGTLLILFDVYITWARIEKSNTSVLSQSSPHDGLGTTWLLADTPIITQYLFFLTLNIMATVAQHAVIRFLARLFLTRTKATVSSTIPNESNDDKQTVTPGQASPAAISTALLVSSCTKLFPILLVIWPTADSNTDSSRSSASLGGAFASLSSYIGWAVLLNNIEALLILLNCGYVVATGLALAGMFARWAVETWTLGLAGLNSPSSRELGILSNMLAWLLHRLPF